jgi:hypothetical protein
MNDRSSRMIRVPSRCPEDWKHHLAHPDTQWKPGYSAWAVAHSWEEAQGFPPEVRQLFDRFGDPFKELEPLVIVAEHSVRLPFGEADSQNDVFVLAKAGGGLVSITVEGKKEESFDKQVKDWLPVKSPGSDKPNRLQFLLGTLGLGAAAPARVEGIYYQLLHRMASAVLEAKRFSASIAVMLVHSFSPTNRWFGEAFVPFVELFGAEAELNRLVKLGLAETIPLYAGWAKGHSRFLAGPTPGRPLDTEGK